MSASPPRRHAAVPMHSNDHIPRRAISPVVHQKHHRNMPLGPGEREKLSYEIRSKHERLVILRYLFLNLLYKGTSILCNPFCTFSSFLHDFSSVATSTLYC